MVEFRVLSPIKMQAVSIDGEVTGCEGEVIIGTG